MIYVLLDTNIYLRLAKRVRPLLGNPFGAEAYEITILQDVEDEVHKSSTLQFYYPWFDNAEFADERLAKKFRLNEADKQILKNTQTVLHGTVKSDKRFLVDGRSPPSPTDCKLLAFSQIRTSIIVTDDIGMHILAEDFGISVWHGYELIKKMFDANIIDANLVRDIYQALEDNRDFTKSWKDAKHTVFSDIFGNTP